MGASQKRPISWKKNCKNFTFVPCIFRKFAIKDRVQKETHISPSEAHGYAWSKFKKLYWFKKFGKPLIKYRKKWNFIIDIFISNIYKRLADILEIRELRLSSEIYVREAPCEWKVHLSLIIWKSLKSGQNLMEMQNLIILF